jgi:hypothetical protein
MPEAAADPPLTSYYRLFSDLESRNIDILCLIRFCRMRADVSRRRAPARPLSAQALSDLRDRSLVVQTSPVGASPIPQYWVSTRRLYRNVLRLRSVSVWILAHPVILAMA